VIKIKVDVCLITHNSEKFLNRVLYNIKEVIPYRRIVLVDGESKDGTLKIAEKHGCEIIKSVANMGRQRTIAYQTMETEWFYSSDDDIILPKNYWQMVSLYIKRDDVGLIDCYLNNIYLTDFALTREPLFKFRGRKVHIRFRRYGFLGCALIRKKAVHNFNWDQPRRDGRIASELIRSNGYKLLQLPFFSKHYDDKTWEDVLEVHAYSSLYISNLLKLKRVIGVLVYGLKCPWLYHHCIKLAYIMLKGHFGAGKYLKSKNFNKLRKMKEQLN